MHNASPFLCFLLCFLLLCTLWGSLNANCTRLTDGRIPTSIVLCTRHELAGRQGLGIITGTFERCLPVANTRDTQSHSVRAITQLGMAPQCTMHSGPPCMATAQQLRETSKRTSCSMAEP